MSSNSLILPRSRFSVWLQAVRAFAFPASITPVLLGGALALHYDGGVNWALYPLVIVCALLYHAATNLISDYFDWTKGVDKDYTFGSSRVIVESLLTPRQILLGGWLIFAVAVGLGLMLVYFRGWPMLFLGLVGLAGGYLYTGCPLGYKYLAFGDLGVFILMGPLMVIGSYFALTGVYDAVALWTSIPVGMLTAAILHSNNTRDIIHDGEARVRTFAGVIGHKASKVEYLFLVGGAFAAVIVMIFYKILPVWSLLVFLSTIPAISNIRTMLRSQPGRIEDIATLDVQTAQHHLLFGLLLVVSLVIDKLI